MEKIERMTAREYAEYASIKNEQRITCVHVGDKFRKSDGTIIYVTYAYRGDLCVVFLDSRVEWDAVQSVQGRREYELLAHLNKHGYECITTK